MLIHRTMLGRIRASSTQRDLFLVMMSTSHVDAHDKLILMSGMDNFRHCTGDTHALAWVRFKEFTEVQAMEFEREMTARLDTARRTFEVTSNWIAGRLQLTTPTGLLGAVCKVIYGITQVPAWMRCMEPLDAVRAIMSCYSRKQQQNLRGKISASVYRVYYRTVEAVIS